VSPSYECAAAQFTAGAYVSGPGVFGQAATVCPVDQVGGTPPPWLLDSTGQNSLMDANGQQAANEIAAGYSSVAAAYQTVSPAGGGTAPDNTVHTLLWQYPAAFASYADPNDTSLSGQMGLGGHTVFSMGHSPIQVCPVGATNCPGTQTMSVTSAGISAAETRIPDFINPWGTCTQTTPGTPNAAGDGGTPNCDPTSSTWVKDNIDVYVPWLPSQSGVGFPIPTVGSSNLFVQTSQLDFSGNLETYQIDYVPWADVSKTECGYDNADGSAGNGCNPGYTCTQGTCVAVDNTIEIRAINASDFLGEVFLCYDPNSANGPGLGDVLHVSMYSSVNDILDWLAAHPGDPNNVVNGGGNAQADCNIIVAYSPYDNYPTYVVSLEYGVNVDTNPGQGFGRVVGATLFNPLYETINQ
jgi:hypothetical protein